MALLDFGRLARRSSDSGLTPIDGIGLPQHPVRAARSTGEQPALREPAENAGLTGSRNMRKLTLALAAAALGTTLGAAAMTEPAMAQAQEQFLPSLVYRTGPYAPNGIPFADGVADYWTLLNERDGGINGVKIASEECETGYATDKGVECYERLKGKGPTGAGYFSPLSTGITFALTEKAPGDKIPLLTMGYGRSESKNGAVFPWNFIAVGSYWTAAEQSKGYKALMLQHGAGKFKVHADLDKFVLSKGKSVAKDDYAQVLYNRGLLNSMIGTEAIRTAMKRYGNKPMTGEQIRWGFENLNL